MPIPVRVAPPVPPARPPKPPEQPAAPRLTLTSTVTGASLELSNRDAYGIDVLPGVTGIGMAPVTVGTTPMPDRDGTVFRYTRREEREIGLPLHLWSQDFDALRALRRQLEDILDAGLVQLTFTHGDGEQRTITGYYVSGLEGSYGTDEAGHTFQRVALVLRCPDPWFYRAGVQRTFTVSDPVAPFLSDTASFFPVQVAESALDAGVEIVNDGDGDAYPVWLISGPRGQVSLINDTTGLTFTLEDTSVDNPVTIDTRRSVADVADTDGDLWEFVSPGSKLWPLARGVNSVRVLLGGATEDTVVSVAYDVPVRSAL